MIGAVACEPVALPDATGTAMTSLFVPAMLHDLTFLTSQLAVGVLPERTRLGVSKKLTTSGGGGTTHWLAVAEQIWLVSEQSRVVTAQLAETPV